MTELPALYSTGTRYDDFNRESGWWISAYVQQTASQNYRSAIKENLRRTRRPHGRAI